MLVMSCMWCVTSHTSILCVILVSFLAFVRTSVCGATYMRETYSDYKLCMVLGDVCGVCVTLTTHCVCSALTHRTHMNKWCTVRQTLATAYQRPLSLFARTAALSACHRCVLPLLLIFHTTFIRQKKNVCGTNVQSSGYISYASMCAHYGRRWRLDTCFTCL